ncbi:MAG: hypothetical protein ACXU86_11475 [Archangium sp.]
MGQIDWTQPQLVAVWLAALLGLLSAFVSWGAAFRTRRDEAKIARDLETLKLGLNRELEAHKAKLQLEVETALEENVRVRVHRELQSQEALLRLSTESQLRLLERRLNDVGELRNRLSAAEGLIWKFLTVAYAGGMTAQALTLEQQCSDALLNVATSGAYVPPALYEESIGLIRELEELLSNINRWVHPPPGAVANRAELAGESGRQLREIAARQRKLFGAWHQKAWEELEAQLGMSGRAAAPPESWEALPH